MDEEFQRLKKIVVNTLKHAAKPFVLFAILISIVLVFVGGVHYTITLDDGSHKEGDKKNVPNNVGKHTADISIDSDGNITTGKTAKELWDEMIANGSRVSEYLDGPEELQKIMNAEMVTNYLDTRPDPSKPIDWKKINKDINSKAVQGIIKVKRANSNGNTSYMSYIDPETFQTYIDNYNKSGSEADKKKALSHFTLEKGYNNSITGEYISPGTVINIPEGLRFKTFFYGMARHYFSWFRTIQAKRTSRNEL